MIIAIFTLAIIFGYMRKGSLKNVVHYKIKLVPLILLSFVMQISIYFAYQYNIEIVQNYDVLIHFVSYIILFAGLMGNFDNKWFILVTLGIVLNFIVIFLNGGRMPVSLDAAEKIGLDATALSELLMAKVGTHQLLESHTLLGILGDIIPFGLPKALRFFNDIYSIGDIVMFVGIFGLLQSLMIFSEDRNQVDEGEEEKNAYEDFKPMDSLEEMLLFEQKINSAKGETAIEVEQDIEDHHQETIVLNTSKATSVQEEQSVGVEITLDDATVVVPWQEEESSQENLMGFDITNNQEKEDTVEIEKEDIDQMNNTEGNEPLVDETPQVDLNPYREKKETNDEEMDTINQFIIVDGKIKKNPNYQLPIHHEEVNREEPVKGNDPEENDIEELELSHIDLQDKGERVKEENHMLQNLTDSDRIDLMKKMKKRKAEGYTLVEITVGDKKINFWKKDL